MNKKGMTLIETVASIFILSIAGLIIMTGFSTVINIIGNASKIKNASDAMLSYAEKTDDNNIRKTVKDQSIDFGYSIHNEKNTINVNGKVNILTSKLKDGVSLKVLKDDIKELVKETDDYVNNRAAAKDLVKTVKTYMQDQGGKFDGFIQNEILHPLYIDRYSTSAVDRTWPVFKTNLLPKAVRNEASTLYMKPVFPWDYYDGIDVKKDNMLVFLSKYNNTPKESYDDINQEIIHIIYDYDDDEWYYYPGNDLIVHYSNSPEEPGLEVHGNRLDITNWIKLKEYIKQGNGWKILDKNVEFDPLDPDASWRDVTKND